MIPGEFYRVAMLGEISEVRLHLAHFAKAQSRRDPLYLGLRATESLLQGDTPRGIALFEKAIARAQSESHEYLLDLLLPLLVSVGRTHSARDYIEASNGSVIELKPPLDAMRSVLAATEGRKQRSRDFAERALNAGRLAELPIISARTLQRLGLAAFYRNDFEEAQERALEAVHSYLHAGATRQVAYAYSLLYVIAHEYLGDPQLTRLYAERLTVSAQRSGDVAMQNHGFVAQLEIAAQSGDVRRVGSIRARLLSNPRNEQYRERFVFAISEALVRTWSEDFDQARALLQSAAAAANRSFQERALCEAFLSLIGLAAGDTTESRSRAERVLNQTAHKTPSESLNDARTRRVARILAACTCILAGDASRGRRALGIFFDPDRYFVELADSRTLIETRSPAMMRGFVRAINMVQASMTRQAPAHDLTLTETRILRLLVSGDSIPTIAARMSRSTNTVKGHVKSIYAKLDVKSRSAVILAARTLRIFE